VKLLLNRLRALGSKASGYRQRKRRRQSLALIAQSELFDRSWYVQTYQDVRDSGADPVRHYFESGWREGRDPGPDFCTTAYLKGNSDVAALAINPLLHYIEHGRFEGRGATHHTAPFRASFSPAERFGPAAPCARFAPPRGAPVRWTRAGRPPIEDRQTAAVGGLTVASFSTEQQRQSFDQALEHLAWISGRSADPPSIMLASTEAGPELRDAWRAGMGVLRTGWLPAESPIVVRAIQHAGEHAVLIGEGCIAHELDFVDVRPANPFYPLLFVFTKADGEFIGFRQLTFPALCRGGLYYPELVALARAQQPDPLDLASADRQLTAALFELRAGRASATVAELAVTLEHADGTHLLFQSEYQDWLANVMAVPVSASSDGTGPANQYLAAAVKVDAKSGRPAGTATLKLASDMIPALSALLMSGDGSGTEQIAGSLIAVSSDGNIGTWVHVPPGTLASEFGSQTSALPTLSLADSAQGLGNQAPLLALRLPPRRPTHDAELLVSSSSVGRANEESRHTSITWLLWPDEWSEQELMHSLETLPQQSAGVPAVVFIGRPSEATARLAEQLFGTGTRMASSLLEAGKLIETSLAGYIGPGIVLHDRRTVFLLAEALDTPGTITATALVVAAERRGKGWVVVADDGDVTADARFLPGATVPIPQAPREFWISRAEVVRELQAGISAGRHVCSAQVAVSRLSRIRAKSPITLPPAPIDEAVFTEALIG
jgi:hypothetical protein